MDRRLAYYYLVKQPIVWESGIACIISFISIAKLIIKLDQLLYTITGVYSQLYHASLLRHISKYDNDV